MKKILALMLAVLMAFSVVACGGDEDAKIEKFTGNAIVDSFANLTNLIAEKGGYISISVDSDLLAMMGAETDGKMTLNGIEMIIDKEQAELGFLGTLMGKDFTDTLYVGNNSVVVNAPQMLGGAYGVNFATYADKWASSYLNPANGGEFAIDNEVVEVLDMFAGVLNGEIPTTDMIPGMNMEGFTETVTAAAERLMAALEKVVPVVEKTEGKYKVTTITVNLDTLAKAMGVLADFLENEKELETALNEFLQNPAIADGGSIPTISFAEFAPQIRAIGTQIVTSLIGQEITFALSMKTSKDNMEKIFSVGASLNIDGQSGALVCTISDIMKDSASSFKQITSFNVEATGVFNELMASDDESAQMLTMLKGMKYECTWNKKDGNLSVSSTAMGQTLTVNANMKFNTLDGGDMEIVFTLNNIKMGDLFNLADVFPGKITVKMSTKAPKNLKCPEFVDILSDESAMNKIMQHMQSFGTDFGGSAKDESFVEIVPSEGEADVWG